MRVPLFVAAITLLASIVVSAEDIEFKSGVQQNQLIELYTSEGCSSCPRAEALLGRLERRSGLWETFVPVAFHVDYWDDLGWKDPFAHSDNTARQHRYVRANRMETAYTPNFFVDGHEWKGFFTGASFPVKEYRRPGVLSAKPTRNSVEIAFEPREFEGDRLHIWASLLGFGLSSDVTRGENQGKTLTHEFVALDTASRIVTKKGSGFSTKLELFLPEDVTPERLGLAVWVTSDDDPATIQTTGGYLD